MNPGAIVAIVVAAIFGVLFFVAILAAIQLPALARARDAARRASCANNLKQIGICFKMFANEHNNELPKSFNDLYPEYITDPYVLVCPSSEDKVGDLKDIASWTSYEIVKTGIDEGKEDVVIVQEKLERAHIPGARNLLFEDGHVEIQRAGAIRARAEKGS